MQTEYTLNGGVLNKIEIIEKIKPAPINTRENRRESVAIGVQFLHPRLTLTRKTLNIFASCSTSSGSRNRDSIQRQEQMFLHSNSVFNRVFVHPSRKHIDIDIDIDADLISPAAQLA